MLANAAGGEERGMTAAQPLYRQLMGPEFDRMPIAVRTLHGATLGVRARLGLVVMTHVLENRGDGLHTRLLHLFFLGIPVPRVLYPR